MTDPTQFQVDLTNCDREPIHQLGAVQNFGFLIAISADWMINHASENVKTHLGVSHDKILGGHLSEIFSADAIRLIRDNALALRAADSVQRLRDVRLNGGKAVFDIAIHRSGDNLIIEGEPGLSNGGHHLAHIRAMADAVKAGADIEDASAAAATELRAYLGFDRVMVYRFSPDGHGSVIAESRREDLESYLGLHYPASDIPQQARELYRRNLLRIIADINETPSPILPPLSPEGKPLDLSLSLLRSVSPIHIEYLKNMGVGASLSVSILHRGKLWGLFACHHMSAKVLPQDVRTGAELFGELFAGVLSQLQADLEYEQRAKAQAIHNDLMRQFAGETSLTESFRGLSDSFQKVIPHDGAAAIVAGEVTTEGSAPPAAALRKLARFLNTAGPSRVFATDRIGVLFEEAKEFAPVAAGILALPVSRTPRDYIILFRKELVQTVNWAGEPNKTMEVGPHGPRLTPRKSFELWREEVRGQSAPWTQAELDAADAMRITLLEVVLRLTEAAQTERDRAEAQQGLLIAELNHRVRNMLILIKGLVNQSQGQAANIDDFAEIIGARIQSLAMAHDQITREHWSPASLQTLIATEVAAYLNEKKNRVNIAGPDAMLHPTAFTTLALVFHELITNSAKHGALSDSRGAVSVAIEEAEKGGLRIHWREEKGPKVTPPTRRGFGSAIIERSIPHDLGGEAEVRFEPDGLEAFFSVPPKFVDAFTEPSPVTAKRQRPAKPSELAKGKTLVVEDNIIVGMEVESIVRKLGASDVVMASNVEVALRALENNDFAYALLDVNLGDETVAPVARKLKQLGVPFIYTTGYGETAIGAEKLPKAPVIVKPYSLEDVQRALGKLG